MNEKDLKVAEALKRKLSEAVDLVDFKVFGSRARGDADEYSDMDVFVEVESIDRELEKKISEISWEVGFENEVVISVLTFTRDELENSPLRASPIVQCIAEEGVRV
ncbi:MAG: nucleotidyltransferase domain-containing protein [Nitrospirae bacterium]|nr:nucleotidyltransferase domain-containing protein [Nitrospirota bacterium]